MQTQGQRLIRKPSAGIGEEELEVPRSNVVLWAEEHQQPIVAKPSALQARQGTLPRRRPTLGEQRFDERSVLGRQPIEEVPFRLRPHAAIIVDPAIIAPTMALSLTPPARTLLTRGLSAQFTSSPSPSPLFSSQSQPLWASTSRRRGTPRCLRDSKNRPLPAARSTRRRTTTGT